VEEEGAGEYIEMEKEDVPVEEEVEGEAEAEAEPVVEEEAEPEDGGSVTTRTAEDEGEVAPITEGPVIEDGESIPDFDLEGEL